MPAPKTVDFQVQSPYALHSYISVHYNTYNVNSVCMHMYIDIQSNLYIRTPVSIVVSCLQMPVLIRHMKIEK